MGSLGYEVVCSVGLVSLGAYNLISATRNFLKSPHSYQAKPFHPFPLPPRQLPLYLSILFLLLAIFHNLFLFLSSNPDPLVKGATPVHRLISLQSSALLLLFLLLTLSLLFLSPSLPHDLSFALSSPLFLLHSHLLSSHASLLSSAIQSKCLSVSSNLSLLAAALCILLAAIPRLFPADAALSALLCLHGLWHLQTGLSLYADAFIPDGCHRLLDVAPGVDGSTQCDLDQSKFRAVAILDLALALHALFVFLLVVVTYAVVAKSVGVRRLGSYEALPTSSSPADATNHSHIQMKALAGTQA